MKRETSQSDKKYSCQYCHKKFTREKTLFSHLCEKKRRALQQDEKHVRTAYSAFVEFYRVNVSNQKNKKTYEEFCNSPYYNAFVKFGSYIVNVKPLYPEKYIKYIITSGIKVDNWCQDELYEKYVLEYILKENSAIALERTINNMSTWAKNNSSSFEKYFVEISPNALVRDIKDGKISPWLVLNCVTGKEALQKLNNEQLSLVYDAISPKHWATRFRNEKEDVALVKEVAHYAKV